MEEKTEVKTYKVDFKCPNCNIGYLRNNGTVLTTYPPIYPHNCNNSNCNYAENFKITYPYYEYK